jgi:hypothetical protein
MTTRTIRIFEMFMRVQNFSVAHRDAFPAGGLDEETFAELAAVVTELTAAAASEASGHNTQREHTATRAAARAALHDRLETISRTARAVALDTSAIENRFRVPRDHGDVGLCSAGRAFAKDAAPLAAAFIAHGLPSTFLVELEAAVERVEQTIREQSAGKSTHIGAHAGIDALIAEGLKAVHRLDAIVINRLRDTAAMAAWASARHVERPAHTKRDAALAPEPNNDGELKNSAPISPASPTR